MDLTIETVKMILMFTGTGFFGLYLIACALID